MKRTKKSAILLGALAAILGLLLATSGAALAWTGTEGCTPGYWKNHTDVGDWCAYSPDQSFESAFGTTACTNLNGMTLLETLQNGGGGESALGRHAVAALLNGSCWPGVDYKFFPADVKDRVETACEQGDFEALKNILAAQNEKGCPLN